MQVVRCGRFVFSFVVCGFVELSALFDKIHGERTEQRDISLVFFSSLHRIHTLLDSVWTYFLVCSLHSSPLLNFQVMVDFFVFSLTGLPYRCLFHVSVVKVLYTTVCLSHVV